MMIGIAHLHSLLHSQLVLDGINLTHNCLFFFFQFQPAGSAAIRKLLTAERQTHQGDRGLTGLRRRRLVVERQRPQPNVYSDFSKFSLLATNRTLSLDRWGFESGTENRDIPKERSYTPRQRVDGKRPTLCALLCWSACWDRRQLIIINIFMCLACSMLATIPTLDCISLPTSRAASSNSAQILFLSLSFRFLFDMAHRQLFDRKSFKLFIFSTPWSGWSLAWRQIPLFFVIASAFGGGHFSVCFKISVESLWHGPTTATSESPGPYL